MKSTLLSVSPFAEDHGFLRTVLKPFNWAIRKAHTCSEALALLRKGEIRVVICERDLPDGGWKDLLEHVTAVARAPCLIVTSRLADELLWAEVLNLGAYDVLAKPFDADEVSRVIELAYQHWKHGGNLGSAQSIPKRPPETETGGNRAASRAASTSGRMEPLGPAR